MNTCTRKRRSIEITIKILYNTQLSHIIRGLIITSVKCQAFNVIIIEIVDENNTDISVTMDDINHLFTSFFISASISSSWLNTFLSTLLAGLLPARDSRAKCWWDSARHSNSAALRETEV